MYLGPYKDPLDVETFYFRARLEKVYGDKVGCIVKVIVRFFGGFSLEVGRFLKIRNCELGFLLPLSQIRNCESENDSFFDSFPIPLDYDSGSNSIKISKNGQ